MGSVVVSLPATATHRPFRGRIGRLPLRSRPSPADQKPSLDRSESRPITHPATASDGDGQRPQSASHPQTVLMGVRYAHTFFDAPARSGSGQIRYALCGEIEEG